MGNLIESATWESGIYRIETTDAVIGGEDGIDNIQGKQLGNRTLYLKAHMDAAEAAITTYGTTLADHTTKLNALDATNLLTDGLNFSKGQVAYSSGSPYIIAAGDIGKIIRVIPNGTAITLRLPALSSVANLGAAFFFTFNDTSALYLAFKALFTSVDGSIVGDVENFRNGDSCIVVKYSSTVWQLIILNKSNQEEPGTIKYFAAATPPPGYIASDGAAISRTTYARLFTHIGVANGVGDGTTTFNVPDGRGVFIRGWDNGRGLDPSRVFGSFQDDEFESHVHPVINTNGTGSILGRWDQADRGDSSTGTANQTSAAGGTETRPKNIALLACIKY